MTFRRIGYCSGLALLAMVTTNLQAQNTKVIDTNTAPPLLGALDALEIVVGGTIDYEDPPYESVADLQDVSTPQQRAANPGYQLLVPRSGHLMAEVQVPAAGKAGEDVVLSDLNLLLASYRRNGLPGDFKVEQANVMFYVTPTRVLGANGAMRSVTSPMATVVTIPNAQRSALETAEAILDAVDKATGLHIVMGSFPYWPAETVSFGATGEPARDAMARLFSQMAAAPLSYRLVFDPRPDTMRIFDYMLNIRRTAYVAPMATPGSTPVVMSPRGPAAAQANAPFGTRVPH